MYARSVIEGCSAASVRASTDGAQEKHTRCRVADSLISLLENRTPPGLLPDDKRLPSTFYYALGRAYSRAMTHTICSGKRNNDPGGQYYTPQRVAIRLLELAARQWPDLGSCVLDPACGAGSLLLAWLENNPHGKRVIGWDIDRHAVRLAEAILRHFIESRNTEVVLELEVRDLFAPVEQLTNVDLVVVNPPFGTHLTESASRFSQRASWASREPDVFALSVERIFTLTKGARFAGIVPDVVRMQPEYVTIRRALTKEHFIQRIDELDFGAFPEVTVRPCLVLLSGQHDRKRDRVGFSKQGKTPTQLPFEVLASEDSMCRWSSTDPRVNLLWKQSCRGAERLGEIAHCHEGIHTGNIRHKLFVDNACDPTSRPLVKGADIGRYHVTFNGRYVRYDKGLIDRTSGEYASFRDPNIFLGPKILSRQTSDKLIACLDQSDMTTDNSLHTIRLRANSDLTLEWLLAFLNSSLATVLYRYQSGEISRPLPQIKLRFLRRLPIKAPTVSPKEVRKVVAKCSEEARDGGVSEACMQRADRIVFDSFGIPESDWSWITKAGR